jgi:hypothetical protein
MKMTNTSSLDSQTTNDDKKSFIMLVQTDC